MCCAPQYRITNGAPPISKLLRGLWLSLEEYEPYNRGPSILFHWPVSHVIIRDTKCCALMGPSPRQPRDNTWSQPSRTILLIPAFCLQLRYVEGASDFLSNWTETTYVSVVVAWRITFLNENTGIRRQDGTNLQQCSQPASRLSGGFNRKGLFSKCFRRVKIEERGQILIFARQNRHFR